jgi:hypothetical protein
MHIRPDPLQKIAIELYETDDDAAPDGASVQVYIEFPYLAVITRDKITLLDGDGEHVLWERPVP